MRPGQWHLPTPAAGTPTGPHHPVLSALAQVLPGPSGDGSRLRVERRRLAGRSDIHVVATQDPDTDGPGGAGQEWAVKQPHPQWHEDNDIDGPLTSSEEYLALCRLHEHFAPLEVPFRVPAPLAHLPALDGFAMEYVRGVTIKELLSYASLLRPLRLIRAVRSGGMLLRQMHTLDAFPPVELEVDTLARMVLSLEEDRLRPVGLALPEEVRRTLANLPPGVVRSRQVRLHGDYGPGNLVLADDGSTVLLDPSLSDVGAPEEDLARFLTLLSGTIRFAPELAVPRLSVVRHRLEREFLRGYYGSTERSVLLELALLTALVPRWRRLRDLTERHNRNLLMAARLRVIDAQVRRLLLESAWRLDHSPPEQWSSAT